MYAYIIYIYIYMYIHAYICIYIFKNIHTYLYMYVYYIYIHTCMYKYIHTYIYMYIQYVNKYMYMHTYIHLVYVGMGWLRLVGSLKLQVSFAKEPYKRDCILQKRPIILYSAKETYNILQKRPIILRSLPIKATPYSPVPIQYPRCSTLQHTSFEHSSFPDVQ